MFSWLESLIYSRDKSREPSELIHINIYNLKFMHIKYFIIFLIIAQDIMYVYLLRSKDEALKMIKHFIREVENQPTMKNQDDKKGLRIVLNTRTKH